MSLGFFKSRAKIRALLSRVPRGHSLSALERAFDESIARSARGLEKAAVLFSGGVDSSLIASALSGFTEVKLYCSGMVDSPVLGRAEKSSGLLGLPLEITSIERGEIPLLAETVSGAIASRSILQLQIALPAFCALRAVKRDSFHAIFSGQGADELFAGYVEFLSVLEQGGYSAVEEKIREKLLGFYERNACRETALARFFGLEPKTPFLDRAFMLQALAFPAEEKIFFPGDALRKHPLRELARRKGLPEEICSMEKKAIQFDAGIAGEVKKAFGKIRGLPESRTARR